MLRLRSVDFVVIKSTLATANPLVSRTNPTAPLVPEMVRKVPVVVVKFTLPSPNMA